MKKETLQGYQALKDSIETIGKNTEGFNYTYADLIAVKDKTDNAIKEAGFVLIQTCKEGLGTYSREHTFYTKEDKQEKVCMSSQAYVLHSSLIHLETGEEFNCDIPLYSDDIDPQAIGSAITYMRRYSLYVLLDLKTEDDDGAKASTKAKGGGYKKQDVTLPEEFEEAKKVIIEATNKKAYYGLVKNSNFQFEQKSELTRIIYPK